MKRERGETRGEEGREAGGGEANQFGHQNDEKCKDHFFSARSVFSFYIPKKKIGG